MPVGIEGLGKTAGLLRVRILERAKGVDKGGEAPQRVVGNGGEVFGVRRADVAGVGAPESVLGVGGAVGGAGERAVNGGGMKSAKLA